MLRHESETGYHLRRLDIAHDTDDVQPGLRMRAHRPDPAALRVLGRPQDGGEGFADQRHVSAAGDLSSPRLGAEWSDLSVARYGPFHEHRKGFSAEYHQD